MLSEQGQCCGSRNRSGTYCSAGPQVRKGVSRNGCARTGTGVTCKVRPILVLCGTHMTPLYFTVDTSNQRTCQARSLLFAILTSFTQHDFHAPTADALPVQGKHSR
eukprot:1156014-Pelagomonas_calceolata.AAC.7